MPTTLTRPLTRWVDHDGETYKLVIAPDGIRITRKNGRKATTLSWDDVLTRTEEPRSLSDTSSNDSVAAQPVLGMTPDVAADVLVLMRQANDRLADASKLIDSAGALPSIIAGQRHPPEPSERERSDWYIEPLLTIQQVARVFGISTQRVRTLPIKCLNVAGEERYHPAEVRKYFTANAGAPSRHRV
jgi:hypothetical protein